MLWLASVMAVLAAQPAARDSGSPQVWRYLTTHMAAKVTQGWQETRTDASISGQPFRIGGQRYEKGLGTHAPGEMVFLLDRHHKRFVADVGVDDAGGMTGSVDFRVFLDGKEAFHSGLMRMGEPSKRIALDVSAVAELRLVVSDGGDGVQGDHADWANAAVDDVVVTKPIRASPRPASSPWPTARVPYGISILAGGFSRPTPSGRSGLTSTTRRGKRRTCRTAWRSLARTPAAAGTTRGRRGIASGFRSPTRPRPARSSSISRRSWASARCGSTG